MCKIKEILRYDFRKYLDILIFITLINCGALILRSAFIYNDGYWHIKCGEYIASNLKNITDIKCYGSWLISDKAGLKTEWLFDLIIYYISKISETSVCSFMVLLYYVTTLLTVKFITRGKRGYKSQRLFYNCIVNGIAIGACALAQARPQQFTMLFIVMFIYIIEFSLDNKKPNRLFLLIPITLLWANIHGGTSMLAYAILIVYIISNSIDYTVGKIEFKKTSRKWRITAIIVLLLVFVAICVNPSGIKLLFHAFSNMGDARMVSSIVEWMPPDAKSLASLIQWYLPMIMGLIALIQYKDKINGKDILLWFMFIYLFARSQRFCMFMLIVEVMIISKYGFTLYVSDKIPSDKISIQDTIAAWIFIIGNIVIMSMTFMNYIPISQITDVTLPSEELVQEIKDTEPKRLYNTYNVGGYLFYNGIDVFVDGRYEPYRDTGIIDDYFILNSSNSENYEIGTMKLQEYNFDYVLIAIDDLTMYSRLYNNSNYKLINRDEKYLYFKNLKYVSQE